MLAQVTLDEHGLKQLTPVAGEDGSGGSGTLEDADFPVGYVYTQFPQQSAPADLGLPGTWTEITSNYAGRFFRAEGGNAAAFGCCQSESNKWIGGSCITVYTNSVCLPSHCHQYLQDETISTCPHYWPYLTYGCCRTATGSWYNCLSYVAEEVICPACVGSGGYVRTHLPIHLTTLESNCSGHCHQVTLSSSCNETRPINYSIRIWKRTA